MVILKPQQTSTQGPNLKQRDPEIKKAIPKKKDVKKEYTRKKKKLLLQCVKILRTPPGSNPSVVQCTFKNNIIVLITR